MIRENFATLASLPATTVIKKSQPQGKAPHVGYDHLNWLLIEWLVLAALPPSTLEEKRLSNSFKILNPSIQLWPGEKYKTMFREVSRSMREDVRVGMGMDDVLRTVKPIISKIREFVQEMSASVDISKGFVQLAATYQEGSWQFPLMLQQGGVAITKCLILFTRYKAGNSMDVVRKKKDMPRSGMFLNVMEKNVVNIIHDYLEHFYKVINEICVNNGYSAQDIDNGGSVSFTEETARKKRRSRMSNATYELTQYLSESPTPTKVNILKWWKVNSTHYPRLSTMTRDFLTVQATSMKPEELLCSKGDEIDKQRYCMPYDSAQAILCIRS
ncbi:Actin binding-like protein [Hibiscus syriacus]|uniref:Actin binding-like protein n=1 Tax=Hibiscus syriacus TaxID=106335 RepID=A0A6A2WV91_HIBSY|nr:Actin binding-like protein [Hibiscus syriacus]